jgi:hypothetical protein
MIVTYEKQYTEQKFDSFTLYSNLSFGSTKVFWEYYNIIKSFSLATKEEITEIIKDYKPEAKSKLRIRFENNEVEFFKENKYVFPEMYIIFK